jgi:hypothetical protein
MAVCIRRILLLAVVLSVPTYTPTNEKLGVSNAAISKLAGRQVLARFAAAAPWAGAS